MTQFNTHAHIRNTFHLTAALMLSGIGAAQTTQGAATHASSTVLAQVRQTPAVAPVKAAIDGAMVMDDRGPSCCPTVMTGPFSQHFAYDQLSGKNMTQLYGLKFLSNFVYGSHAETVPQTLALDQQMMLYSFYIGTYGAGLLPSGYVANSVALQAEIRDATPIVGPNGTPNASTWNNPPVTSTSTGTYPVRAW